jgi:hypothetical protein
MGVFKQNFNPRARFANQILNKFQSKMKDLRLRGQMSRMSVAVRVFRIRKAATVFLVLIKGLRLQARPTLVACSLSIPRFVTGKTTH